MSRRLRIWLYVLIEVPTEAEKSPEPAAVEQTPHTTEEWLNRNRANVPPPWAFPNPETDCGGLWHPDRID